MLTGLLLNCAPLTPQYDVPDRPVEKPNCKEYVLACKDGVQEGCDEAILCMYLREQASEKYIEVLKGAIEQIN